MDLTTYGIRSSISDERGMLLVKTLNQPQALRHTQQRGAITWLSVHRVRYSINRSA